MIYLSFSLLFLALSLPYLCWVGVMWASWPYLHTCTLFRHEYSVFSIVLPCRSIMHVLSKISQIISIMLMMKLNLCCGTMLVLWKRRYAWVDGEYCCLLTYCIYCGPWGSLSFSQALLIIYSCSEVLQSVT